MATIIGFGFEIFAKDNASRQIDRVTSSYDAATDALGSMEQASRRTGQSVQDDTQKQIGAINSLNTFILRGASIFRRLQFTLQDFSDRTFGSMQNAVMQASTLESQMMGVTRTTGLTGNTIRKLEDRLLTMSDTLPLSALELGKVAVIAGQLGVAAGKGGDEAVESISKLAFTAAQAARTFGMSEFAAARALAQLSNVFREDINNAGALSSVVAKLSATTVATSEEIINAATRMGALTKSMGASTSEALAWAAAIRQVGGRARQGATAISKLFTESQLKAAKFAAQMGLTTEEFQNRFRQDATGTLLDFLDSLKQVEKTKLPLVLKDLGLSGRAATGVLLPMIQMTDQIRQTMGRADQAMREAAGGAGELTRQFGTMTQGLGPAIATLKGSIQNLVIRAGRPLLGLATMLVNALTQIVAIIGMIPAPVMTAIMVMAGMAATAAAVGAAVAGVIAGGFLFISMGLTWLGTLLMLTGGMGTFKEGIISLYGRLNELLRYIAKEFFGSFGLMQKAFQRGAYQIRGYAIQGVRFLKGSFKDLHAYLLTVNFKQVFTGIFSAIHTGALKAVKAVSLFIKGLSVAKVTGWIATITKGFWAAVGAIKLATTATWAWAVALGVTGILKIMLAIAAAIAVIWVAWKALGYLWDATKWALEGIWEVIKAIGLAIYEFFAAPLRAAWTILSDMIDATKESFGPLWEELSITIEQLWVAVEAMFGEIWGLAKQLFFGTGAWANTWKEVINLWKNVGLPIFKLMISITTKTVRFIKDTFDMLMFSLGLGFGFITTKINMLRESLGKGFLSKMLGEIPIVGKALEGLTTKGGGTLGTVGRVVDIGGIAKGLLAPETSTAGSMMNLASSIFGSGPEVTTPASNVATTATSITSPATPSAGSPANVTGGGSPVQTSAQAITTPRVQLGDVVVPITVTLDGRELFSTIKRISMEEAARRFGMRPLGERGVG